MKWKKSLLIILCIIFGILIILPLKIFILKIFLNSFSFDDDSSWTYTYITLPNKYRLYDDSEENKYIVKYTSDDSGRRINSSVLKINFDKRYVIALQYAYCSFDVIKNEKSNSTKEDKSPYCKVKLKNGNYVTYDKSVDKIQKKVVGKGTYEVSYYDENGKRMTDYIDYNQKYYWILDTKEDILYGPYKSKRKYIAKKKELGIENLKLKKLNQFKHVKES